MEYRVTGGKKQNNFYLFIAFISLFIVGALFDKFVYHWGVGSYTLGYLLIIGGLALYVYSRRYVLTITQDGILAINYLKQKKFIPFTSIETVRSQQQNLSIRITPISNKPLYFQLKLETYFDQLIQELKVHRVSIQET